MGVCSLDKFRLEEVRMASTWETFKGTGEELLGQVKRIIAEGNASRVVIKQGSRTVAEFPLAVGLVGAVAAPTLGAIGALAAFLTNCTLHVERTEEQPEPAPPKAVQGTKMGKTTKASAPRKKASRKRARRAA
jgi:hypothetical protein